MEDVEVVVEQIIAEQIRTTAIRITTAVVAAAAVVNHVAVANRAVVVNHAAAVNNIVVITISMTTTAAYITCITSLITMSCPALAPNPAAVNVRNAAVANVLSQAAAAVDVNAWSLFAVDVLVLHLVAVDADVGVGVVADADVIAPASVGTPTSAVVITTTFLQLTVKVGTLITLHPWKYSTMQNLNDGQLRVKHFESLSI